LDLAQVERNSLDFNRIFHSTWSVLFKSNWKRHTPAGRKILRKQVWWRNWGTPGGRKIFQNTFDLVDEIGPSWTQQFRFQ